MTNNYIYMFNKSAKIIDLIVKQYWYKTNLCYSKVVMFVTQTSCPKKKISLNM